MQENKTDKTPNFGAAYVSIFKMNLRKISTEKMSHMRSAILHSNSTLF